MENFSFDRKAREKIERHLKIKLKDVIKLNIKDDVILKTAQGGTVHVPFKAVDEIARPACFACPDFANDYADISCGGLGSPDGFTTSLIRTGLGEKIYNGAKQSHYIEELAYKSKEKARIHKSEMMAKIVSFARRKKERAKKRLISGE
jgi:coenzyme F420 hydrogenase subunit beta